MGTEIDPSVRAAQSEPCLGITASTPRDAHEAK
jgi:hypothetical protein